MLNLDAPLTVAGLDLFADHASPTTFHYLPPGPRLRSLELIRYRGGERGGFLTLDVAAAPDPAQIRAAAAAIAARIGAEPSLVPVLFDEGTCRLVALDADGEKHLVEAVLGTTTPSLLGDLRAIFSLALTPEGTTLVKSAATGEPVPLALTYDLAFRGLRAPRSLHIEVDYHMAYDYLRTRAAAGMLVFRGDVDAETEKLVREGQIRIRRVDTEPGDAAEQARREAEALDTAKRVARDLFWQPATSPAALGPEGAQARPAVGDAWAAAGRPRFAFLLRDLRQEEQQTLTYDLTEATVGTQRVAPQGTLTLAGLTPRVRDVDLDGPDDAPVDVRIQAPEDADWSGVEGIVVDVRVGDQTASLRLAPDHADDQVTVPAGPAEQRLRLLRRDEPEALGAASDAEPAWTPLPARTQLLDPAALSGRRVVEVALGFVAPDAVRAVEGRLAAGERERAFLLDAATASVRVPVIGAGALRVEATVVGSDGERWPLARDVAATERLVALNPPADVRTVEVRLADPLERYAAVHVEIETADGERRRVLRVDAASPAARWSSHVPPAGFRFLERRVGRDASVTETAWQERDGVLLVVGDLEVDVTTIDVYLLNASDHEGAFLTVEAVSPPEGAPGSVDVVLDPGVTFARVRLPVRRGAPPAHRVTARLFTATGDELERQSAESLDEVVLLA